MTNRSRAKGTQGETELVRWLREATGDQSWRRTPAGSTWDLERDADERIQPIDVLAIRPDRGKWLVTIDLITFLYLVEQTQELDIPMHVEVKRFALSYVHNIWEHKFGRGQEGGSA